MHQCEVEITNRRGLHARAAAKFVNAASAFESQVTVTHEGEEADGQSILSLMVLGAAQGSRLQLRVDGPDEDPALEALVTLIRSGFDEHD